MFTSLRRVASADEFINGHGLYFFFSPNAMKSLGNGSCSSAGRYDGDQMFFVLRTVSFCSFNRLFPYKNAVYNVLGPKIIDGCALIQKILNFGESVCLWDAGRILALQ